LCRVTKANDYLLLSASREQVFSQDPPTFIPMVREPPKNIFFSPVAVLDFQSLYPSIMIAYNICYSTCLGKLFDDESIREKLKKEYKQDYLRFYEEYKKYFNYCFDN
jgi:DNA polymerase zeta